MIGLARSIWKELFLHIGFFEKDTVFFEKDTGFKCCKGTINMVLYI